MVAKQDYPSWYSMTKGSGNDLLMENWGGGQAIMPSCGGIIGNWCYAKLGGIRPDPSGPGFKKILIKPAVVSGVDWVECSHDSPYGKIISNWRRTGGELVMDVTIPPNTTARVVVPGQSKPEITADGRPLPAETLVKCLEASAKATSWSVPAGHFRFTVSNVAN
jgi:alpha-L-rhamnosidase